MWREVALAQGFITREQLPEIPYAKAGKDQSFRRSSFSAEEWTQLGANSTSVLDRRQKQVRRRWKPTGLPPDHAGKTKEKKATNQSLGQPCSGSTKGKALSSQNTQPINRSTERCCTWRCGSQWNQAFASVLSGRSGGLTSQRTKPSAKKTERSGASSKFQRRTPRQVGGTNSVHPSRHISND